MKWTTEEQFKLLRTALVCNPNFKMDAKAVAEAWPVESNGERPTERAVRERYRSIMASAHDVQSLNQTESSPTKTEDPKDAKDASIIGTPQAATPRRASRTKAQPSTGKTSAAGSKRNRRGKTITSDAEGESDAETSSGSETQLAPTPPSTRKLRARKARATATATAAAAAATSTTTAEDSDKDFDAGAKEYDSGGSDGDYDFEEERRKKAAKKAKDAKLVARRASRGSNN